jgi:AcrR family transcriptional regulator
VLHTAAALFAARGYRDTSVKDVADEVGMTKGAVYHHFPTKEALAIAVVEAHYAHWPVLLEEVRAEGFSAIDTAMKMLDRAADVFGSDPVVQAGARLQLERSLIGAPLPTPYTGWTDLLTQLLTEARIVGDLHEDVTPEQAAQTLVATFFGVQHISDTLHARADIAVRWREARALLFRSIRA